MAENDDNDGKWGKTVAPLPRDQRSVKAVRYLTRLVDLILHLLRARVMKGGIKKTRKRINTNKKMEEEEAGGNIRSGAWHEEEKYFLGSSS